MCYKKRIKITYLHTELPQKKKLHTSTRTHFEGAKFENKIYNVPKGGKNKKRQFI